MFPSHFDISTLSVLIRLQNCLTTIKPAVTCACHVSRLLLLLSQALQEALRVLKPGGRFICLEFSKVTNPLLARWDEPSWILSNRTSHAPVLPSPTQQHLSVTFPPPGAAVELANKLLNSRDMGEMWSCNLCLDEISRTSWLQLVFRRVSVFPVVVWHRSRVVWMKTALFWFWTCENLIWMQAWRVLVPAQRSPLTDRFGASSQTANLNLHHIVLTLFYKGIAATAQQQISDLSLFSRLIVLPLFFSRIYDAYSFQAIPVLGEVIAGDWKSYQYLVESIRKFPDQVRLEPTKFLYSRRLSVCAWFSYSKLTRLIWLRLK